MMTIALAGNPNSGKTTLFNNLTGSTAHVGNWPGVTVEQRYGTYRNKKKAIEMSIMDLPGIYSLSPYTPEEIVSRTYILDSRPDAIINIVDATNLERNLYLTTQLLELNIPLVVALNMMDAAEKDGTCIDIADLSRRLGVPVVGISALKNTGLDELMAEVAKTVAKPRIGQSVLSSSGIGKTIEKAQAIYEASDRHIEDPLFHAIKALENDEIEAKANEKECSAVKAMLEKDGKSIEEFEPLIADERYQYISKNYVKSVTRGQKKAKDKLSKSDKADKVLTNKWAGIPIFLVILFLVFHLTFSEDLFFLSKTGWEIGTFAEGTMWEGVFYSENAIMSPGFILANALNAVTDWFNGLVGEWLGNANAPALLQGFICDGVLGGVFAVMGFLPQILLLFFFFSILEDSGYMARVAFILDRLFRRFGLSGRAVLPMIMGFGCGVPAMVNTRTLASEKERIQTIRVIPFFTCSAKLPILVAVAGAIISSPKLNIHVDASLITYSMYLIGVIAAIIAICIMHNTTLREKVPPFIMELPAYHAPQFRALGIHVWDKTKHCVQKLFTIILVSTIAVWAAVHMTWDWKFVADPELSEASQGGIEALKALLSDEEFEIEAIIEALTQNSYMGEAEAENLVNALVNALEGGDASASDSAFQAIYKAILAADADYVEACANVSTSILASLGKFIQPIFTPMGFGSQTGENGWVYSVACINGLIAKENVISTFGTLAGAVANSGSMLTIEQFLFEAEGASDVAAMINATNIDFGGLYAFMTFNLLTIPCFASVATAKGELPKGKLWLTVLFWLLASSVGAALIYTCFSFPWTIAIWACILIALVVFLVLWNRRMKGIEAKKGAC